MKKYLILLLFLFIPFNVFADVNLDTSYTFDIFEEDFTDEWFLDNSRKDILDYYSNYESEFYNILVLYDNYQHRLVLELYSKNDTLSYSNYSSSSYLSLEPIGTKSHKYIILNKNLNLDYFNSSTFSTIDTCLNDGLCWNNSFSRDGNTFGSTSTLDSIYVLRYNNNKTINNNNSYVFDDYYIGRYIYNSQVPLLVSYNNLGSGVYTKNLVINGLELSVGDNYPSYVDLFLNTNTYKFNVDKLPSISIGGISKNDISSFKFTLDGEYSSYNYISSLRDYSYIFGRVVNNGYYSYIPLNNCVSLSQFKSSFSINSEDNTFNYTLYPNGFSCSDDLTNIDNIYIFINFNYQSDTNSYLYNVDGKVTKGSFTFNNHNRYIYEKFDNLSYDTSILLSTLSDTTEIFIRSNNRNTLLSPISSVDNKLSHYALDNLQIGMMYQRNALVYNYPSDDNPNVNIELLFNDDVIMSISNNNNYTYYDSNGDIQSSLINNDIIINFNNNYDTSYYNNVVSNYIDGFSDDIYQFSLLIQSFYDSLPDVFQIFIYVMFILMCFYFTYLLIKR